MTRPEDTRNVHAAISTKEIQVSKRLSEQLLQPRYSWMRFVRPLTAAAMLCHLSHTATYVHPLRSTCRYEPSLERCNAAGQNASNASAPLRAQFHAVIMLKTGTSIKFTSLHIGRTLNECGFENTRLSYTAQAAADLVLRIGRCASHKLSQSSAQLMYSCTSVPRMTARVHLQVQRHSSHTNCKAGYFAVLIWKITCSLTRSLKLDAVDGKLRPQQQRYMNAMLSEGQASQATAAGSES
eukprot:6213442-Pleurochrysis_carterae.AAC.1